MIMQIILRELSKHGKDDEKSQKKDGSNPSFLFKINSKGALRPHNRLASFSLNLRFRYIRLFDGW